MTFKKISDERSTSLAGTPHDTPHEPAMMTVTEERVLAFCKTPRSRGAIEKELALSSEYVRKELLPRLIHAGRLAHTLPDKPRSRRQRYVTVN